MKLIDITLAILVILIIYVVFFLFYKKSRSNFETFQSNRLKIRYRNSEGKTNLAHTLNGSSLALPRVLATIIENFQTEGGINIPKALQPYTGFSIIK